MVLEMAKINGNFIGFRLTIINKIYLIWRDQESMPGIRIGDSFIPGINENVTYDVVYSTKL
jgi:hypothetical protein